MKKEEKDIIIQSIKILRYFATEQQADIENIACSISIITKQSRYSYLISIALIK